MRIIKYIYYIYKRRRKNKKKSVTKFRPTKGNPHPQTYKKRLK
jgi:hypothetical protein